MKYALHRVQTRAAHDARMKGLELLPIHGLANAEDLA